VESARDRVAEPARRAGQEHARAVEVHWHCASVREALARRRAQE
jgi:hypothetical protein